jgi:hypothetical protein
MCIDLAENRIRSAGALNYALERMNLTSLSLSASRFDDLARLAPALARMSHLTRLDVHTTGSLRDADHWDRFRRLRGALPRVCVNHS